MALSKLQTDYMQTQDAFSVGVFATRYTTPWSQPTPDGSEPVRIVCTVHAPAVKALASDLGLREAGWVTRTANLVVNLIGADYPELKYSNIVPRPAVDFVDLTVVPTGESLLAGAVAEGAKRASHDGLLSLTEGIFELIGSKSFDQIDFVLRSMEPEKVAPEILVTVLRATSGYTQFLHAWAGCLEKARHHLAKRGLPADQILIGLIGEYEQA